MTRKYVRWTSAQEVAVHEKLVAMLLAEYPTMGASELEATIPTGVIRKMLPQAQSVLEPYLFRQHFSDEQIEKWAAACSSLLRKQLLKKHVETLAVTSTPTEELLRELSRRMSDQVAQLVLDQLGGPLLTKLEARVDLMLKRKFEQVEQITKHRPTLGGIGSVRKLLPTYVVLGTIPEWEKTLLAQYQGKCLLKFVEDHEYNKVKETCQGKICVCLPKVPHSLASHAKAVASKFTMVRGHLKDVRELLDMHLRDFNTLSSEV
jgi:hypothetical protein